MLKSEWVKPGTGRTVGELRRWVKGHASQLDFHEYQDPHKTALDIVRVGPPEPYDVERVEEAIRRVEVEMRALGVTGEVTQALSALENAKAALGGVHLLDRWAEAQADTEQAIRLMDYCLTRKTRDRFEEAREVFHGAKAVEMEAWRQWQACR